MGRLDVEEVDAGYGDFQALYQLSLHVDSGETVAIIGANGAGKTTLLRAVMGQVKVRSGTIRYAGQDLGRRAHPPAGAAGDGARAGGTAPVPEPVGRGEPHDRRLQGAARAVDDPARSSACSRCCGRS